MESIEKRKLVMTLKGKIRNNRNKTWTWNWGICIPSLDLLINSESKLLRPFQFFLPNLKMKWVFIFLFVFVFFKWNALSGYLSLWRPITKIAKGEKEHRHVMWNAFCFINYFKWYNILNLKIWEILHYLMCNKIPTY